MPVPRLIAIVDVPTCTARGLDPVVVAKDVAGAGAPSVLLRARTMSGAALRGLAADLVARTRGTETLLLVSADWRAAADAGAAGVHLPAAIVDQAPAARAAGLLTGVSVHSPSELRAARDAGADYVIAAPVFDPSSKPPTGPPLGIDGLAALCRAAGATPVIALGGVTSERTPELLAAGAWGVAALGPFCTADPASAVRAFLAALAGVAGVAAPR